MDPDTVVELTNDTWVKTREAVAHFRKLLLCSKCSQVLIEPVCLGVCEHLLCRPCAGPYAGDGCSVCHSPAWVKDIQINRQLSNITELFRNLESLLHPSEVPAAGGDPSPVATQSTVLSHQKNFKIWFSPRSRKVRCRVEKPARVNVLTRKTPEPPPQPHASSLLSVYNFTSSSQDSGSSVSPRVEERKKKRKRTVGCVGKQVCSGPGPRTRFQNKEKQKKMRLEAVNQQWGFGKDAAKESKAGEEEEEEEEEERMHCGDIEVRSNKKVSFQHLAGQAEEEPHVGLPQGGTHILSPEKSILKRGAIKEVEQSNEEQSALVANIHPSCERLPGLVTEPEPALDSPGYAETSPCRTVQRTRLEECGDAPQLTPRRPRLSPGMRKRRRRRSSLGKAARLSAPPPDSSSLSKMPVPARSEKEPQEGIPASSPVGTKRGPAAPAKGSRCAGEHRRQISPAHMKRNRKGETPLHLAAIKGDVNMTTLLLTQGADPNLKDHAGWTPLHEACNLGHLGVVELLLQQGALLNTPGYENDSPLHDAVRNGHVGVARRLLEHGASPAVLNKFGLRPVDYATSQEMREILTLAPVIPPLVTTPLSPSASLSKSAGVLRKPMRVTLIGTKLTQSQQDQLTKAAQVLGGNRVQTFSSAVTHVVVPDGGMPSTLTALQGILGGCWMVRFSWLAGCLQQGMWLDETAFEAGEGPRRARANTHGLLPQLFDGCFFYLLGSFRKPPKDELLQLIKAGGGQLLARQPKPDSDVTQTVSAAAYHAQPGSDQALCTQYVLYDPLGTYRPGRVRLGKVWSAPSSWLLDCITAFDLLPVPEL